MLRVTNTFGEEASAYPGRLNRSDCFQEVSPVLWQGLPYAFLVSTLLAQEMQMTENTISHIYPELCVTVTYNYY